jgi:hypothetical protein
MSKASQLNRTKRRANQRRHANLAGRRNAPLQPIQQRSSQWLVAPAASRSNAEAHDGHAALRNGLRRVADGMAEYAGIPMPLDGEDLVIEPTYHKAAELMAIGARQSDPDDDQWKLRNEFWSVAKRSNILVMEDAAGKITFGLEPGIHHFKYDIHTLGCADAWGIEQESAALQLLAGMLSHRQFKQYLLTGMFLESSDRSGLTYMFRRLKPTVAISKRCKVADGTRILCTLCLHPIAYYSGSWAGAMTPTDDVVAHLSLMRGDEHLFWKRANQHPAYRPESGL